MSGPGDDRWRNGPSRQSSQRQPGSGHRGGGQGGNRGGNAAWNAAAAAQEQHVPVRGFNAAEAKNILKRGPGGVFYLFSVQSYFYTLLTSSRTEPKAPFYKPTGKDNQRSGGPWGSKSNTMANGKDFFVELRKQVASLQRGGPAMGG